MKNRRKRELGARLALLTAALVWGSSFFIVKDTTDRIPPNFLLAVRFTLAFAALAVLFYRRLRQLTRDDIIRGAIIGLCLFVAYSSQTVGITDTTPGKNAFLTAVYCVIVPFLFWAVNKTRPDRYHVLAAILCLAGIGLVSLTQGLTIRRGDALTLLGGFFYALHMVLVARLARKKDPILISIVQFGFAGLFAWMTTLALEPKPGIMSYETVGAVCFLSFGCTAFGLLMQNIGQKYTHPATASILLSLESVFGVLFSVLLYGERLTGRLILGFALIFAAIFISETKLSFFKKQKSE